MNLLALEKRETVFPLRVSDIKQYLYCQRVIYFTYVLPVEKKSTFKMEYGKEEHINLEALEKRRKLSRYGIKEGERIFQLFLNSKRLQLSGKLDMLIRTRFENIPVEFKNTTGKPALSHKYQLVAYAMLVEEKLKCSIKRGLIYLIPDTFICEVPVTQNTRLFVKKILEKIRRMIRKEEMPPPNPFRVRCRDCEFKNFCADIY